MSALTRCKNCLNLLFRSKEEKVCGSRARSGGEFAPRRADGLSLSWGMPVVRREQTRRCRRSDWFSVRLLRGRHRAPARTLLGPVLWR